MGCNEATLATVAKEKSNVALMHIDVCICISCVFTYYTCGPCEYSRGIYNTNDTLRLGQQPLSM